MTDTIDEAGPGVDIGALLASRGHLSTSWTELGERTLPNGVVVANFSIGDPGDPASPAVFKVDFPPGCRIEPHAHKAAYAEIILSGSQKVSGRWHHAGDVRIASPDQVYGPLIAGDEGASVLVMFADSRWEPVPLDGSDAGSTLHVDEIASRFS